MQVKFSTFIIALSFLTFLFGVVITSPIPGAGGGSPLHPGSRLSPHKSIVITYPSPTHKPYVHDKPYPMAPEPVLTKKEWHKERVQRMGEHIDDIKGESKQYRQKAGKAISEGKVGRAAKEVGKSCISGLMCTGARAIQAVHAIKAH